MNRYFKGWYLKAESDRQALAVIPAIHISDRNRSASIQIVTEAGAWSVRFPYEQFAAKESPLQVRVGENVFSEKGIRLNIRSNAVMAAGSLAFGPLTPLPYDIMGPFRYVPFMECRHSVISLTHTVTGFLTVNRENYVFDRDIGYIEGDRGRSFPKNYVWTQCNFFDETSNSIMLSAAEIPLGGVRFTGVIGVVLWRGRQYRLATYLGAKAETIGNGTIVIRQGRLVLTVKLQKKQDNLLYAPSKGRMERLIHESLRCTAYYRFEKDGEVLFEFVSDRASFEYEYNA